MLTVLFVRPALTFLIAAQSAFPITAPGYSSKRSIIAASSALRLHQVLVSATLGRLQDILCRQRSLRSRLSIAHSKTNSDEEHAILKEKK
jgi:hypothetical protein